jgi:hypothetical protein
MKFRDLALRYALRIRVVHRLPGRLRLHVEALRSVPEASRHLADEVARLLALPEGVESVDVSFVTGNLLVRYDVSHITEQEILDYYRGVLALALKHWDKLSELPGDRCSLIVDRIEGVLQGALRQRVALDEEIELPDGIWS